MPGITGQGNTFNLPNFVGNLFSASPEDTPFLSAIGGLTGGKPVQSVMFNWSTYDLRDADDARQRIEGADAPQAEERARVGANNVVEIHQETVEVSYTKQAAVNQFGGTAPFEGGINAVQSELPWQLTQSIKQVARDVNKGFIVGKYALPADNKSARKTRGLIEAVPASNKVAAGGPLTRKALLDLMQKVWEAGGIQETETRTILVSATLKRALTDIFSLEKFQEQSRNVGGVNVQVIETDFGKCNIMLERYVPADTLIVASLEECTPRFLEIPGKGHFFAEPLAKTGSSDKVQLYGEIGLEYGNPLKHGVITGATAAAATGK